MFKIKKSFIIIVLLLLMPNLENINARGSGGGHGFGRPDGGFNHGNSYGYSRGNSTDHSFMSHNAYHNAENINHSDAHNISKTNTGNDIHNSQPSKNLNNSKNKIISNPKNNAAFNKGRTNINRHRSRYQSDFDRNHGFLNNWWQGGFSPYLWWDFAFLSPFLLFPLLDYGYYWDNYGSDSWDYDNGYPYYWNTGTAYDLNLPDYIQKNNYDGAIRAISYKSKELDTEINSLDEKSTKEDVQNLQSKINELKWYLKDVEKIKSGSIPEENSDLDDELENNDNSSEYINNSPDYFVEDGNDSSEYINDSAEHNDNSFEFENRTDPQCKDSYKFENNTKSYEYIDDSSEYIVEDDNDSSEYVVEYS